MLLLNATAYCWFWNTCGVLLTVTGGHDKSFLVGRLNNRTVCRLGYPDKRFHYGVHYLILCEVSAFVYIDAKPRQSVSERWQGRRRLTEKVVMHKRGGRACRWRIANNRKTGRYDECPAVNRCQN